jgi:hypothetical protein
MAVLPIFIVSRKVMELAVALANTGINNPFCMPDVLVRAHSSLHILYNTESCEKITALVVERGVELLLRLCNDCTIYRCYVCIISTPRGTL